MVNPITTPISLGLDFGTESVRALLVDAAGTERGVAIVDYPHGQIVETLPGDSQPLPSNYALQHPSDWIDAAASATRQAMSVANVTASDVVGIGVDFTSCTMLPTQRDGTPLCLLDEFAETPLAWPKLWKHHGAVEQTERMNQIARDRDEPFLKRYGGIIGLEWLQPKILETIESSPNVAAATDVWIEAGDWFVWQLVGGDAESLPRSTCQAGYKALWSASDGYPPHDYFEAVHPELAQTVATKLPGRMLSPGQLAGHLTRQQAERFGLQPNTPVSAAIIDAHSAVPGVGAGKPGTLVMVLGTSSCHMLNGISEQFVPGLAGVVDGGILPDLFGYETGQAAVGDAFDWLRKLVGHDSFESMTNQAAELPPGANGVRCLDWFNGCRTPLMDGSVRGALTGLSLSTKPGHLYRALLEASACGLRWIVTLLRDHGVTIDAFVATGGLPHHNREMVQVYADVLGAPIEIHPSTQGPAVGAAILGMVAAGSEVSGFSSLESAIESMASVSDDDRDLVEPNTAHKEIYDTIYNEYRQLADQFSPS